MTNLTSEQKARDILEPHLPTLKTIMQESLEALNKALTASGETLNNRAKCSLFHSIAVEKAKKYFKDSPGIVLSPKYQSLLIIFDGELVGRIKKVNKEDLSRNAKTHRNQLILSQQNSLFADLIDFPTTTFIDIAYRIDSAWTEFERLVIVCRLFEDIKWRLSYKEVTGLVSGIEKPKTETADVKEESQITIKKAQ